MRDAKIIRDKVKIALKFKELNQHDLSCLLDMEYHHLQRYLSAGTIQKYRLEEIAKILNISPLYLSGEKTHIPFHNKMIEIDDVLKNKENYISKYPDADLIDLYISYHYYKRDTDLITMINDLTAKITGINISTANPLYTKKEYEKITNTIYKVITSTLYDNAWKKRGILLKIPVNKELPKNSPFYKEPNTD